MFLMVAWLGTGALGLLFGLFGVQVAARRLRRPAPPVREVREPSAVEVTDLGLDGLVAS